MTRHTRRAFAEVYGALLGAGWDEAGPPASTPDTEQYGLDYIISLLETAHEVTWIDPESLWRLMAPGSYRPMFASHVWHDRPPARILGVDFGLMRMREALDSMRPSEGETPATQGTGTERHVSQPVEHWQEKLASLPLRDRHIFALRAEGFTLAEISQLVGIPSTEVLRVYDRLHVELSER